MDGAVWILAASHTSIGPILDVEATDCVWVLKLNCKRLNLAARRNVKEQEGRMTGINCCLVLWLLLLYLFCLFSFFLVL